MNYSNQKDIICALATPNGVGAIGVIRVSGEGCIQLFSANFNKDLTKKDTHTIHFGNFKDNDGNIVDEVLVSIFQHGKSFTGEESVEISTHGSPYILQKVMEVLVTNGARIANPGEFTMRAFFNGKLDLSQAEAVADLIASQSQRAHEVALKQLKGNISSELKNLREELIHFASLVELELDFAEEDVEFADRTELLDLVTRVLHVVTKMIQSFELGNAIKNGVPVAIVGAPNTGKSTLLNQLLNDDRAIVSNIAGTTRDVIEESLNIDGIVFRLIDTAGIRETEEEIEAIGIQKSLKKIQEAQLIICMMDATKTEEVAAARAWYDELIQEFPSKKIVKVLNKIDMAFNDLQDNEIGISAKENVNMENLTQWMVDQVIGGVDIQNEIIVTNARHRDALVKTQDSLTQARMNLENGITGDFVAMDIRQAMFWLGSITGQISEDDLLANIFSKFCIGK